VEALIMRFSEAGLQNCSMDQMGNGMAMLPGSEGRRSLLLVAHADSVFDDSADHAISLQPGHVTGCAISDNSIGLAALATLPALFEKLGLRFQDNLIFLAPSRSTGRGNLEGLRHFLAHNPLPLHQGICLEGAPLGRLSYQSVGMRRGEIRCRVPEEYDWSRFGASGAVIAINQVISRISAIPLPRQPVSSIVLGSLEAGHSYDRVAHTAILRFEIRSESSDLVRDIGEQLGDIVAEVEAKSGANLELDIFAQRQPGGIAIGHPLVRAARQVIERLGTPLRLLPDTSELSALIDAGLPAVAVGLSTTEIVDDVQEQLQIRPLYHGLAQVVALLRAMDGGLTDEA
jgi:tripeptide aminopeptidase